jgi:hypothetical protein
MEQFGLQRRERFLTGQRFEDHAELLAKVSAQGPTALKFLDGLSPSGVMGITGKAFWCVQACYIAVRTILKDGGIGLCWRS